MGNTNELDGRFSRRTVLKGVAAFGAVSGLAWAPSLAQDAAPQAEVGEGKLTTTPENPEVAPGGTLSLVGTGFVQRPADGHLDFIMDDHLIPTDDGEDIHLELPASALDANGNFTASLTVPTQISEGRHWVRVLAGLDGGPAVSKFAFFTVIAADATPTATEPSLSVFTDPDGAGGLLVYLMGSNLEPGATASATMDGAPFELKPWGSETIAVDDTGSLIAVGSLPAGSATTGDYELEVTITDSSGADDYTVPFTIVPNISFSSTAQGTATTLTVISLPPGAEISEITAGDLVFDGLPITVGDDGVLKIDTTIPAESPIGEVDVTVAQSAPEAASYTGTLNITPSNALIGTEQFVARTAVLNATTGQPYQSAYSATNNAVFVTTSAGEGPGASKIFKLDADTLAPLAEIDVAQVGSGWPVFGIGLDDTQDTVWVTNTLQNTAAVFAQSDLSLVQQLDANAVGHSRDVIVDAELGKAFVSGVTDSTVAVFSTTAPFDKIGSIQLPADDPEASFSPVSLALDPASHTAFTVSLNLPQTAVIDAQAETFTLLTYDGSKTGSGVAYDPASSRLFIASQDTSNVLVVDVATGEVVANTPTGGGALNVAWDAANGLAYVTNRGAGTVTVVDIDGNVIANLDGGVNPNHVSTDGQGSAFVVHSNEAGDCLLTKLTYQP